MRFLNLGKAGGFSVFVVAVLLLVAANAGAQQAIPAAGKITASYVKIDTMMVNAAQGHGMFLGESDGTNTGMDENKFMDGATAVNCSYSDLTKGSGSHQGYLIMAAGADSAFAKWGGTVTTKMNPEGPPTITFKGSFTWQGGAGKYAGISGQGTYSGAFTSATDYAVEWQGDYILGK